MEKGLKMFHVAQYKDGDIDKLKEREQSDAWAWRDRILDMYDNGAGGLGWTGWYDGEIAALGFIIRDAKNNIGLCPVFTSELITKCGDEVTEAARGAMEEGFAKLGVDALAGTVTPGFQKGHEWCQRLGFTDMGECQNNGATVTLYIKKRGE